VIKVALKGLAGRKLRASLSAFAIILGVAMVSGTFVLTDTMNGAFDSIITQSYKNADVIIQRQDRLRHRHERQRRAASELP